MNFIEALKLKSKLFFLFITIAVGLVVIGIIGTLNLNGMKKNLDSLYFGSFVPVLELNTILQTYQANLINSAHKAKSSQISLSQMEAEMSMSINIIENEWKSYESHYKKDEEVAYIEYASSEIKATNDYLKLLLSMVADGDGNIKKLNIAHFENKMEYVSKVINKLIVYEMEVAKYERKKFLSLYNSTLFKIGSILFIVIISVLAISYYVFKSIQKDQSALEIAAKKLKIANKKLESASYVDSLTGLYNRRYFNMVYERELKRAKRAHSYITFMMLDIDYFKQYNDTYGHLEGDNALKSVAKVLQDALKRPSDFVFRLGGEEFGILLSDTDEENSATMAQTLCSLVKEKAIEHRSSKVSPFVTVSIGVACCVADEALSDEMLLSKADEMLYKAKESGRDGYKITSSIMQAKPIS